MKNKLLVLLFCCHLLAVAFRSFKDVRPQHKLITSKAINSALDTYTAYTSLQSDYRFFSPDVGNASLLNIKVYTATDSFHAPFDVANGEMGIRRFTSLNAFNNAPEAREFMTRSWAAHTLRQYPEATGISVSYYIQVPPTIAAFAQGKRTTDSLIFLAKYNVDEE